jgi:hypothetical protein
MKTIYRYTINDNKKAFYVFSSNKTYDEYEYDVLAFDVAYDYYYEEGYEIEWPIKLTLYTEDKKPLCRYEVEREWHPSFSTCELDLID